MSFEVTVTPTVYDVEVAVNPSVQPFDVEVTVGNVPDLDLTTNGDSGASTFDPLTGELNIPEYTLDGLGGVPESRTLTINGTTQDLSANRTFTIPAPDPVTIGTANGLSLAGQVLSLGLASSGANGALSSTDWSTFNNKQNAIGYTPENVANKAINFTSPDDTKYPTTLAVSTALAGKQDVLTNPITGTGVAGQVSFWTGTSTQSGDNGLFWDNGIKSLILNESGTKIRFVRSGYRTFEIRQSAGTGLEFFNLTESLSTLFLSSLARVGISTNNPTNTLDVNGTGRIRNGVSLADTSGNVVIGSLTDAGFRLDVVGTTRLNGLQTFQGTTASDTAPLGSELATTGSGTNWTGTDFATGYTHAVGSTASLTTSIPAVSGTYYQIAYTVTGRTAGSFTINYGGTSTSGLTSTGATGPRATSTADLEIVPTTDFDGTVVLSVRSIGTSSATTSFTSSNGNVRIEMRANTSTNNTLIGISAGRRITTGSNNSFVGVNVGFNNTTGGGNSFFGVDAGLNNTTGSNNSFFGVSAGFNNTTGGSNSFVGVNAGLNNTTGINNSFFGLSAGRNTTTGNSNSFFGVSAGQNTTTGNSNSFFGVEAGRNNTTGINNSFIGLQAGLNNTTGESNSFIGVQAGANNTTGSNNLSFGRSAGRLISSGGNLTIATNSVFLGFDTRANADNESNQIVIGNSAIGLGSNTTVIGNSSTTFGRWWGRLLIGTSTDAGFDLDVNGTARVQGALSVTTGSDVTPLTISGYSLTGSNDQSALSITGNWNTTGTPTALLVNVTDTASDANSLLCAFRVGGSNRFFVRKDGTIQFLAASISNGGGFEGARYLTGTSTLSSAFNTYNSRYNYTNTSGDTFQFIGSSTFTPTSGSGTITGFVVQNTINQTGGANGITRGLYVNPTLTSAFDWRSIEWSNNTGRGLWGVGTADNAMAGALNIGSATNANASAILELTSTTRGLLPPRMTGAQAEAISSPAEGLLVYSTDGTGTTITSKGWWGFNGSTWAQLN